METIIFNIKFVHKGSIESYMCHLYISHHGVSCLIVNWRGKKHILFSLEMTPPMTTTKSYRKPLKPLIHIGSTYFLFLFFIPFFLHRPPVWTVSHPNNSILIFPLNVSFLHRYTDKKRCINATRMSPHENFLFIFVYYYLGHTIFFLLHTNSASCAANSLYDIFLFVGHQLWPLLSSVLHLLIKM